MIGSYRHFDAEVPGEAGGAGGECFVHRTQNMVCVYLRGPAGAKFTRAANPDEYFAWVLRTPVVVDSSGDSVEITPGSLVIVPPGASAIRLAAAGEVWLGFTALADDLLELAPNADEYKTPLDNVAPIEPWPSPPDGYRVRVYDLDALGPDQPKCFRHATAMTNFQWPIPTRPRDPRGLSPHTHPDFEQASLIHSGTMVHHLRRAWGRDATAWLDDEHVKLVAPALAISKPPDLHTTQAVSDDGPVGLVDFFSPPRWDFSHVAGMVVNAEEYPMPNVPPPSYARDAASSYAPDDPRRGVEGR